MGFETTHIIGYSIVIIGVLLIIYYVYSWWSGDYQLSCIISTVDGNKYCVRERGKVKEKQAVDLLASTMDKCKRVVDLVAEKFPDNDFCQRLKDNYAPDKIAETLPTSTLTAYTENKGEAMSFCLNVQKSDNSQLIDADTLLFVALHELAHCGTYSIGHKTEFWQNFKFLLEQAKVMGIYTPIDYKKNPQEYCGMTLSDNPYYDLQE